MTSSLPPATSSEPSASLFNLIIIGGGINGAGIARDASMRGLKVLLLDKNDFAYGTSSRSTRLIHGGIRYLENFEFKLVWEACHERHVLCWIAPQLVRPMPFIIPVYRGDKRPLWFIRLGMFVYDRMAGFKNLHPHRALSRSELLKLAPALKSDNLVGGGLYYDAKTDDARLVLANIQDAARHGAQVKNYTEVTSIKEFGQSLGIQARDVLTGEQFLFQAPYVVNATGPWLDRNFTQWNVDAGSRRLRLTKGVHFFVPKLLDTHAILVPATDGRVFFVIPWGDYSLIGTTDTDYGGHPDDVSATKEDKEYLLKELNRLFPDRALSLSDIRADFAGLRPLLAQSGKKTGAVSREYRLEEVARGDAILLSVIGGKITTYRHLAEIVTGRVMKALKGSPGRCRTASKRLPGSRFEDENFETFRERWLASGRLSRFTPDQAAYLLRLYGSEIENFLALALKNGNPAFFERIIPESPAVWGQLVHAVQNEFVRTPDDFIHRRTDLSLFLKDHPDLPRKIEAAIEKLT